MASISRPQLRSLFLDQRDRLFGMLLRLSGNPQDAEDLLQETFLVVWRKREDFEGRGAPEGYLRTTAFRLFLNKRQARGSRANATGDMAGASEQPDPAQPCPGADMARRDAVQFLIARVNDCLATLSPEVREAFILFRHEGLSVRQIAEMTGAPPKTVETRVRRATLKLAEQLRPFHSLLPAS